MTQKFDYYIRKNSSGELGIIIPIPSSHEDKIAASCVKIEGEIVYTYHANKVEFPKRLIFGIIEKE